MFFVFSHCNILSHLFIWFQVVPDQFQLVSEGFSFRLLCKHLFNFYDACKGLHLHYTCMFECMLLFEMENKGAFMHDQTMFLSLA